MFGSIVTNVEPYDPNSGTPAANDFSPPDQLANLPSPIVLTGTESEMQAAFDQLGVDAKEINAANIPYDPLSANSNYVVGTFENSREYPNLLKTMFFPVR